MTDNIASLLFKVLKAYDISITYSSIEHEVSRHPEYPSMQSISDALDGWKIKHVVLQLTVEKLIALEVPVIAHLKKGEFIWVTQIADSKVHFWSEKGKEKTKSLEHFEQEWSGIALAIENIDDAGEPDFKEKRCKERKEKIFKYLIAGSIVALLIMLTCFAWTNDSSQPLIPKLILLCINAVGCYIGYLLIRQAKYQSNTLSDKFCIVGKYIDCNKVTHSKYSSFWGFLSWAELGTAYFSSMLLWVSIAPLSDGWLSAMWLFSLASLPFTLWSLVTQAFVIRKWCLFCCSVVLLLWTNTAMLLVFYSLPTLISVPAMALMTLLFVVSIVVVMESSKGIGAKSRLYAQHREMAKVKFNIQIIQSQLSETAFPFDKTGLTLGNPDSPHDIAVYISIGCSHCGNAVKELRRLTDIYPDFCLRLLFSVSSDDFEDKTNVITRHMLNLYKDMNKNEFFDMLETWYQMPDKTLEALQKSFPASSFHDFKTEMEALYQINQQNNIGYTPALLMNGRLLSQVYSYKDLYGIARALNCG